MTNTQPAWIIQKKRDGKELETAEIQAFIQGLTSGDVADYQATAFLMAVYFRGMTLRETVALTESMLASGERYDLSHIPGPKVDKHSTGGVGDKTSLIIAPLAAACGLKVPMMSGRGLGHSGGTLDKLEAIPGFRTNLSQMDFEATLSKVGCAMIGQSERMVPADKKLYALRDVTATVECVPLIVASILSKKVAEGAEALVLDVKVGNGAFMKTMKDAQLLSKTLSQVARKMGIKARALITNMHQPLGYAAGNAIEVRECIQILRNEPQVDLGSADLKELSVLLCAHMLELGGLVKTVTEGRKLAYAKLADGSAWHKFLELVDAQDGTVGLIRDECRLPNSPVTIVHQARKKGYVTAMNTEGLGRLLVELGGGRAKASDRINPGVGLTFHKKLGARVLPSEALITVNAEVGADTLRIEARLAELITVSGARKPVPKLIFGQY